MYVHKSEPISHSLQGLEHLMSQPSLREHSDRVVLFDSPFRISDIIIAGGLAKAPKCMLVLAHNHTKEDRSLILHSSDNISDVDTFHVFEVGKVVHGHHSHLHCRRECCKSSCTRWDAFSAARQDACRLPRSVNTMPPLFRELV